MTTPALAPQQILTRLEITQCFPSLGKSPLGFSGLLLRSLIRKTPTMNRRIVDARLDDGVAYGRAKLQAIVQVAPRLGGNYPSCTCAQRVDHILSIPPNTT